MFCGFKNVRTERRNGLNKAPSCAKQVISGQNVLTALLPLMLEFLSTHAPIYINKNGCLHIHLFICASIHTFTHMSRGVLGAILRGFSFFSITRPIFIICHCVRLEWTRFPISNRLSAITLLTFPIIVRTRTRAIFNICICDRL